MLELELQARQAQPSPRSLAQLNSSLLNCLNHASSDLTQDLSSRKCFLEELRTLAVTLLHLCVAGLWHGAVFSLLCPLPQSLKSCFRKAKV